MSLLINHEYNYDIFDFALLHRQGSTVQASDVVITDTRNTSIGSGLEVQFYVQGASGGVIAASTVVIAIQVMKIY